MTCSTHQDNTLCRAYYQESYDRAKMTYSRIDLLERGPSFTQLMQNATARGQAIARELCTSTIHVRRGRGHVSTSITLQAARRP